MTADKKQHINNSKGRLHAVIVGFIKYVKELQFVKTVLKRLSKYQAIVTSLR